MKKIFKNKLLLFFLILFVIAFAFCAKIIIIFTESDEKVFYGARLDGIDKVTFKEAEKTKKITEKLGGDVENVSIRTQGRIINILLNMKGNTSRDASKEDANKVLEEFSDDEKNYYDIQFFIYKKGEAEDSKQFPIMGYKHHTKSDIIWTKDRTGE